jgi:DNA-binding winged helix-turn-helix (wHTH) protein/tetratricopeptide (TPR) repeat protein
MQLIPTQTPNAPSPRIIRFGIFEADLTAGELRKGGKRIRLQEQPFQILAILLGRPGQIVTRDELRSTLWPGDTFVDFEHGVNSAIARLRDALGDSADSPRYIETLPRRGYRLIVSVDGFPALPAAAAVVDGGGAQPDPQPNPQDQQAKTLSPRTDGRPAIAASRSVRRRSFILAVFSTALLAVAGYLYFYLRPAQALTETDSIVLADFTNSTSDPVFDSTLRQALAVKLIDSPFLNIVPDERMRDTLRFMGRSSTERLTTATAREVCQRLSSKAMLTGSIAQLDDHYSILLEATNCANGDSLARAGAEAVGKGQVLKALDLIAADMRRKLGESLSSIQKYDMPIEQATTTSLEGLRAFSLGQVERNRGLEPDSIPYFQHAIELDPNFAMAYAVLGQVYANMGESALSVEYTQKAFDRRERASERENFYISSHYYENVTHDLDRAIQTYELWRHSYPRDITPAINLGDLYFALGQPKKAIPSLNEALRLDGSNSFVYSNLLFGYLSLNRLDEAKSAFDQARSRGIDTEDIRMARYIVAFLEHDPATMKEQVAWANDKAPNHGLLALNAATAAFAGRLHDAEDLFKQNEDTARRYGHKESAAEMQALVAIIEADFGRPDEARRLAAASLAEVKSQEVSSQEVEAIAGLALARAGDAGRAQSMAMELSQRFPSDTLLNGLTLPTIRAAAELSRGNTSTALRLLEPAQPYVMAKSEHQPPLYTSFLRGQIYLRAGDGKAAQVEFQKLIDHSGIVASYPQGALARLGLARARHLAGDVSGSRMAYQDFFALWKDADPGIPVLQQARAEYATLH